MKKSLILLLALAMLLSSTVFALNVDAELEKIGYQYDPLTGETTAVALSNLDEHAAIVYISLPDELTVVNEAYSAQGLVRRYLKGSITYTVTGFINNIDYYEYVNPTDCYVTQYLDDSYTGSGQKFLYYWDLLNNRTNATMNIYDAGIEIYTNAVLTYNNVYAPCRWGTTGTDGLARLFYTYNNEFFGGDQSTTYTFVYQ